MGDANPPLQQVEGYQAGTVVVFPRPNDLGYPMRHDEFEILCEGGVGDATNWHNICVSCLVGTIVGVVAMLATADWDNVWKPGRREWFLLSALVLFLIIGACVAGAVIYHLRITHSCDNSPFTRLKSRIERWYAAQVGHNDEQLDLHSR